MQVDLCCGGRPLAVVEMLRVASGYLQCAGATAPLDRGQIAEALR